MLFKVSCIKYEFICTEISISFKAYGSLTLTTSFYSKNIHFFQTLAFPQCTGTECRLLPPWCLDHNWAVLTITTQPSEHTVAEEGAWVWTYKLWVYKQSKGSIWISKLMMSLKCILQDNVRIPTQFVYEEIKHSRPWMTLSRYSFFVLTCWLTGVWPRDVVKLSSYSWIPSLQAVTGPYQSQATDSWVSGDLCRLDNRPLHYEDAAKHTNKDTAQRKWKNLSNCLITISSKFCNWPFK